MLNLQIENAESYSVAIRNAGVNVVVEVCVDKFVNITVYNS
jgi:hypothetical protein